MNRCIRVETTIPHLREGDNLRLTFEGNDLEIASMSGLSVATTIDISLADFDAIAEEVAAYRRIQQAAQEKAA